MRLLRAGSHWGKRRKLEVGVRLLPAGSVGVEQSCPIGPMAEFESIRAATGSMTGSSVRHFQGYSLGPHSFRHGLFGCCGRSLRR